MNKFSSQYQSPQSLVLRFMREKRKLTLLYVGKEVGIKPKLIDHMEQGRRIISDEEIHLLLNLYSFTLETFNEMQNIKPLTKQTTNHYFLTQNNILTLNKEEENKL